MLLAQRTWTQVKHRSLNLEMGGKLISVAGKWRLPMETVQMYIKCGETCQKWQGGCLLGTVSNSNTEPVHIARCIEALGGGGLRQEKGDRTRYCVI